MQVSEANLRAVYRIVKAVTLLEQTFERRVWMAQEIADEAIQKAENLRQPEAVNTARKIRTIVLFMLEEA